MLGVKYDNRESVHDLMKVVLTPNIGLEKMRLAVRFSRIEKLKPAQAGLAGESQRGRTLTTE
jgi:hypothetical protein